MNVGSLSGSAEVVTRAHGLSVLSAAFSCVAVLAATGGLAGRR